MKNDLTHKSEAGFTLIELLITLLVSSIVMGLLASFFVNHRRSYAAQELLVEMSQNTRAAMDMMTREIRMAGYNPNGATFTAVEYNTGELRTRADLNGTTVIGATNEVIYYRYDSANKEIQRYASADYKWRSFAENIGAFTFQHLDEGGNLTTVSDDIRQIRIDVTGCTSHPVPGFTGDKGCGEGFGALTLTSLVKVRNLGLKK